MEIIWGKQPLTLDRATLAERLHGYPHCLADVGTGDGRYVQHVAQNWAGFFALGIDACRENLRTASRAAPGNALYVIANACALPAELHGVATHVSINFPWGSLLTGLLEGDAGLLRGLVGLTRPGAQLDVRLNGGALSEAGWSLAEGVAQIRWQLQLAGFVCKAPTPLCADELRRLPTSWAKRLAFGRDPRALALRAVQPAKERLSRSIDCTVLQPGPVALRQG